MDYLTGWKKSELKFTLNFLNNYILIFDFRNELDLKTYGQRNEDLETKSWTLKENKDEPNNVYMDWSSSPIMRKKAKVNQIII